MNHSIRSLLPLLPLVLVACQAPTTDTAEKAADAAYLYKSLGSHKRAVTSQSAEAQRFFDQGLVLAFAFNHDEAIRSFREAARLDPSCAMAWWGIALANGPHINNPALDPERARVAWEALGKATELAAGASPVERALIEALGARYSSDPAAERKPLDQAYANAMRAVWRAHPRDADVGTLFAESLMDLHPWDLWTPAGEAKQDTPEIVETLEKVLEIQPDHPGACHLYVHGMEASPQPVKALPAANRLRTLVPDAGHLVHMPAHIDLRLGDYAAAAAANLRAIEADRRHRAQYPAAGFYRIYMAHNNHFLTFVSMLEGRSEAALKAAREMVQGVPPEFIEGMGAAIDGYMPIVLHVLVRFGRWEEVLREPAFPEHLTASNALRLYARAVALTALGRLEAAEAEQAAFLAACGKVDGERKVGNSPAHTVLAVARNMLAGELAFRRGRADEAFASFRKAVEAEDTLQYDEPPDWTMPVRHALGAALMEARRFEEAEKVFREDLVRFPDNGWSLFGLARCLRERKADAEAREAQARFDKAWARADVKLKSSCFCQPGA